MRAPSPWFRIFLAETVVSPNRVGRRVALRPIHRAVLFVIRDCRSRRVCLHHGHVAVGVERVGGCRRGARLRWRILQKLVVANVEVLRHLSRFEPHQRDGDPRQEPFTNRLAFAGINLTEIDTRDNQVQQVFFALKLISIVADRSAKVVGLNAYRLKSNVAPNAHARIKIGQLDREVFARGGQNVANHVGANLHLFIGRVQWMRCH